MRKKVLVLGSTGMLGHMVLKVLSKADDMEVRGTHLMNPADALYFDVLSGLQKLDEIFELQNGFDYFINCIGITTDRITLDDPRSVVRAIKINASFPNELALWADKFGARIIHISTDGVFSGRAESYDEDAPADCPDVYGKTKSLGEVVHKMVLNIRCSIIGPSPYEKGGLYEWFRTRPAGAEVSGYTNYFWNGVTIRQFAELCLQIIREEAFDVMREESPLFHFAPNPIVTKYDLLQLFRNALHKDVVISPVEHAGGVSRRILKTKYQGIRRFYPEALPMKEVLLNMIAFD